MALTSKQDKAIVALLSEVTVDAAAKSSGISVATMWRWMKEPDFRKAYLAARRQVVDDAISLMQRASKRAVATLIANLDCDNPSVQVRSAQLLIDHSMKGVELLELECRLQDVEQALELPVTTSERDNRSEYSDEMERG